MRECGCSLAYLRSQKRYDSNFFRFVLFCEWVFRYFGKYDDDDDDELCVFMASINDRNYYDPIIRLSTECQWQNEYLTCIAIIHSFGEKELIRIDLKTRWF